MRALARWCIAHRRIVVVTWVVALIAANGIGQAVGSDYNSNFKGPNSAGSQQALNLLAKYFPARKGDTASIVFESTAPIASPAVRSRIDGLRDEDRLAPARQRRRLALRGRPRDLTRRAHRLRERVLRPALLRAAEIGDQPGDPHGRGGSHRSIASDPARRLADRAGRAAPDRPRHGRRDPRGDDHPADHLRHARRGRPAADRRAARARHGDRPDRGAHARRRRRQLHPRARGDDRARRRHRLRALHSDPLPLRPRRGARARRGDRHGDGHLRSSRAVRRRDRGDRHARTATGGRQLPARTGDRLLAHGAPDDGGGAHAASRRALQARARHRPLRRIRPASAERAARPAPASGSAGRR